MHRISSLPTDKTALDAAIAYLRAGLSVVPVRTNGTKRPAVAEWASLQARRMTETEALEAFAGDVGVALIGGAVSGGLEILDFEAGAPFVEWGALVEAARPGLLATLPHVETPSGGHHLLLRSESPQGNQKLAERAGVDAAGRTTWETLIETRGTGGYVLTVGSPGACHSTGLEYRHVGGPPLTRIPTVWGGDRQLLLDLARSFNERHAEQPAWRTAAAQGNGTRPGDDFNRRGNWPVVLESHGWQVHSQTGERTLWTRPGKAARDGVSATTGHCSSGAGDLLYVFSSNAAPLEPGRAYSKFSAFAVLNHGGDFAAAALALSRNGWGEQAGTVRTPAEPGADTRQEKRRVGLLTIPEVLALPSPEWLVDRLIPKGSLACIFGQPGAGKSFIVLDLLLAVARGADWHGYETKRGAVVYCAGEGGHGLAQRIRAWGVGNNNTDPATLEAAFLTALEVPQLLEQPAVHALAQAVEASLPAGTRPAIIAIDTLGRAMAGRKENAFEDMSQAVEGADLLRRLAGGATVLLVHHSGKDPEKGERGHTALRGGADTLLELTQAEGEITLAVTKQKDGAPAPPLALRLEVVEVGEDERGRPLTSCYVRPRTLSEVVAQLAESSRKVLELLRKPAHADGLSATDICDELDMKKSTFFNAASSLITHGAVTKKARRYVARA